MKIIKVSYKCLGCNKYCVTTNHNLLYRQHYKNEHYCFKCLIKLTKSAALFAAIPTKYHGQIFLGIIDHDIAITFLKTVRSKIAVRFCCDKCGTNQRIKWNKLLDRKHDKFARLCYGCLQSKINNSNIVIEANAKRSRELWKNNEYKKKCIAGFETHNLKMQHDTEYSAKHKRRSRSISGTICFSDRSIRFDSAFELIYINFAYDKYAIVRRCDFIISYGSHFYHPDFFVISKDGTRSIIEIKGYYRDNVEVKSAAAINFIEETNVADEYVLYDTDRLISDGILIGVGGAHMWRQIRKIYNARTVEFTEEKHRRIAEIGHSRYYKEKRNKENRQS